MRAAIFIYLVTALAALVGWVMNLVEVISLIMTNAPLDGMFIGRIIGIPVGILGAVLGWF